MQALREHVDQKNEECMGNSELVYDAITASGYSLRLCAFSAIDRYARLPPLPFISLETSADITALARLFENLRFPGAALADAALSQTAQTYYFHCLDSGETRESSFDLLSFSWDVATHHFYDPADVYPLLKAFRDEQPLAPAPDYDLSFPNPRVERYRALMDAALILSRYSDKDAPRPLLKPIIQALNNLDAGIPPNAEEQRRLLISLLQSSRPDLGLTLLKAAGFIAEFWGELASLDDVDHAKEFHPEGNVWNHTLETFRYRKTFDARLSLGLLLHDIGKPLAAASGHYRFAGHAELGARVARKFLTRLEFDAALIDDVSFLVRNHMLPAAVKRLPLSRTQDILESPLFPTLLELYRCDESSSFKGLDGYYKSSAAYQAYLKQRRNPYRAMSDRMPR
jgi:poly(A) polymerase